MVQIVNVQVRLVASLRCYVANLEFSWLTEKDRAEMSGLFFYFCLRNFTLSFRADYAKLLETPN